MGNVSTSMGGTGVALRKSAWGLYYNPALLASDPRSKFSFSAGFWVAKNDINPLLELKFSATPDEVSKIFSSLKEPRINLTTQMGVVAQIGDFHHQKDVALPDEYGRLITHRIEEDLSAFAIGAFAASQTYFGIQDGGNFDYIAQSFSIALMEIPLGYAYQLNTTFGDFNFGIALKYMRAVFDFSNFTGSVYDFDLKRPKFLKMSPSQNFGLDLGFLYSIANFHLGLSAKNINVPHFDGFGRKLKLSPSLRMGLAYDFLERYTVTMDADLLPQSFSEFSPKSHYVGLGFMGDYNFVDFRLGFGTDVLNFGDSRISAGFNVFGILDVVGEMGFNFAKKEGSKLAMPTNFGFKIGSTFAF